MHIGILNTIKHKESKINEILKLLTSYFIASTTFLNPFPFIFIHFHALFLNLFLLTLPLQDEGDEQEEQRLCPVPEDRQGQTEAHRYSHQTATQPHRTAPYLERAS